MSQPGPPFRRTEPAARLDKRYAVVTAVVMAVIVYGSLYPFHFRVPSGGEGAVAALLGTWHDRPGRGDFLANILLYAPLGFFGVLAVPRLGPVARVVLLTVLGLALSTSVELTQYDAVGRNSTMTDMYSNTLGTALGAVGGVAVGAALRWRMLRDLRAAPAPGLIVAAWLGDRLYPYAPTIDLHKYWNALKPVVLSPALPPYDLFRFTVMWIAVAALVELIVGRRRWWYAFPALGAFTVVCEVLILTRTLSVAELAGGAIAFLVWAALQPSTARARVVLAAALVILLVAVMRLEPFAFGAVRRPFEWIPFLSFMHGFVGANVQSFFEKFFYYGAAVWLLAEAGTRLGTATGLTALLLFATGLAETYMPGRSAEITDAAMALVIGGAFAVLRRARAPAT